MVLKAATGLEVLSRGSRTDPFWRRGFVAKMHKFTNLSVKTSMVSRIVFSIFLIIKLFYL